MTEHALVFTVQLHNCEGGLGLGLSPENVITIIKPDTPAAEPADGDFLLVGDRVLAVDGEELFYERCATCHGEFGEGVDRWPVLMGGFDTLTPRRWQPT